MLLHDPESTPMTSLPFSFAASITPSPDCPAAVKITDTGVHRVAFPLPLAVSVKLPT